MLHNINDAYKGSASNPHFQNNMNIFKIILSCSAICVSASGDVESNISSVQSEIKSAASSILNALSSTASVNPTITQSASGAQNAAVPALGSVAALALAAVAIAAL